MTRLQSNHPLIPSDQGRRYTQITIGTLSLSFTVIRIFLFKMPETPRYLLSKGRDGDAVKAVNHVARQNKKSEPLTVEMLQDIDAQLGFSTTHTRAVGLSNRDIVRESLQDLNGAHYKALFATKRLSLHTALIWLIWLTIGTIPPCAPQNKGVNAYQESHIRSTSTSCLRTSRPDSPRTHHWTSRIATTASSPRLASWVLSPQPVWQTPFSAVAG